MTIFNLIKRTCMGALLLMCSTNAYSWGQKGHDVTCAIAENHLSRRASKEISRILEGKSMVYWANWMDNASNTDEYRYTKTWHYKNIDADETWETAELNEKGDVVRAINESIAALKGGKLSKEEEALTLKFLIHLVGDLHCPMHMGHKSDRGGNAWQIQFFGRGTNLHSIYDSGIVESTHKWTYTEWAKEVDTVNKKEAAAISAGNPEIWGKETYLITSKIYESTPVGSKLSYDYQSKWTPVIEIQLLRGGLRLAAILNEIF